MNMLLLLGWNPGTEQEMFSLEEAAGAFDLDRVIKSGARFNPDKAKWFNEQHLRSTPVADLVPAAQALAGEGVDFTADQTAAVLDMMLERIVTLDDLKGARLHTAHRLPEDAEALKDDTDGILKELADELRAWPFKRPHRSRLQGLPRAQGTRLRPGLLSSIALTGEGGGPSMFAFAAFLGLDATLDRLTQGMNRIAQQRAEA